MRKISFAALVALVVLVAAACQDNLTGPSPGVEEKTVSEKSGTTTVDTIIKIKDLVGTWQATKAEGWNAKEQGSRRDLVAEGGSVTLVLEEGSYTITVAMPRVKTGVDTGKWYYSEYWGDPQIDFYPSSLKEPNLGNIPAFLVALYGDTLRLWDSGLTFLPFDFGWSPYDTHLDLVFTRI